jgi:hypothetical protein
MEIIHILLIIIIILILIGFYTIREKRLLPNRLNYECPNCNANTWLGEDSCYSCNKCGWCVDPYGNGSCAKGNKYGPLFKQCESWSFNGNCMWGPNCGNNGPVYITEEEVNPYPWYRRWFWPRFRVDSYNTDHDYNSDDDINKNYTVNNYNYIIKKHKKRERKRNNRIRERKKNKEILKKQELKNLIKPDVPNFKISNAFKDNNKKPTPIVIKSKSNDYNINKKISIPNPLNNQNNQNNQNIPNLGTRRSRRISRRNSRRRSGRRQRRNSR